MTANPVINFFAQGAKANSATATVVGDFTDYFETLNYVEFLGLVHFINPSFSSASSSLRILSFAKISMVQWGHINQNNNNCKT